MAALTDSRITEIIARHRPAGIELRWKARLHFHKKRDMPFRPAHACNDAKEIYCADPREFADECDRRRAVAIFLHECAHFKFGHVKVHNIPRHQYEYEAEMLGQTMTRMEGIAVPRRELRAAKEYIRHLIKCDDTQWHRSRGFYIASHVRRWANGGQ